MTNEDKKDKRKQLIFLIIAVNIAVISGMVVYKKYIAKK